MHYGQVTFEASSNEEHDQYDIVVIDSTPDNMDSHVGFIDCLHDFFFEFCGDCNSKNNGVYVTDFKEMVGDEDNYFEFENIVSINTI